jgi:hypothetical protein
VQNYTQPISFGISSYELPQWLSAVFVQDSIRVNNDLTIDAGCATTASRLTDANDNVAPRVGFGWHPNGDARTSIRGGYGMYYTQLITNVLAGYLVNGLDGSPPTPRRRAARVPDLPDRPCLPLSLDPETLPPSQLPARDITIQAGQGRLLPHAVREVRAELRSPAELSRCAREPAQPGDLDRRRA